MAKLTEKEVEELIKKVHSGQISVFNLPVEVFLFNFKEIFKEVKKGFGKIDTNFKEERLNDYRVNIGKFSGAKTFQEVKDMSMFVFDDDGAKRSFKEFKEFARTINETYNVNWLKAEQDTAFAMSQGADHWASIEEEKEIFPLLKYQTIGDARVRPEHAAWDNIIRPVEDPFWNTRMPPNGFRCRCRTIQLESGKKTNLNKHLKEVNKKFKKQGIVPLESLKNSDKVFNVNPGKVNFIFDPKTHPYFQVEPKFKSELKRNFGFKTPEE